MNLFRPGDKVWYQDIPGTSQPTPGKVLQQVGTRQRVELHHPDGRISYVLAYEVHLTPRRNYDTAENYA